MTKNMKVILAVAAVLGIAGLAYTLATGGGDRESASPTQGASASRAGHAGTSSNEAVPAETAERSAGTGTGSGPARMTASTAESETVEESAADGAGSRPKTGNSQRRSPKRRPKAGKQDQGFEEEPQPEKKKIPVAR